MYSWLQDDFLQNCGHYLVLAISKCGMGIGYSLLIPLCRMVIETSKNTIVYQIYAEYK